jgi:flavin reductase (DIM6/NTAB) family NADH-FMN oxidoreductase RutF
MGFHEIDVKKLTASPFSLIGDVWFLLTAGGENAYNTMTASWGGMGVLWGKNVVTSYIRPQRHTLSFIENEDLFTLCFFDETYRDALKYCGSHSGRDVDKAKETGLTPVFDRGTTYFAEASLVLICKKMYKQDFDPACFLDPAIEKNYANKDYHRMFIGEILCALSRD